MSTEVKFRRGTTAQHATFTGALGELTIDTDKDIPVIHDGVTPGGFPVEAGFPSGTRLLFQQPAAPTGWTKEVAAAFNDVALRIVTGAVGGAGADAFTTVFGTGKVTGEHTLLTAEIPSHTHPQSASTQLVGGTGAASVTTGDTTGGTTGATGGGGSHDHTMGAMDLAFKDVIIAQKD